MNGHFFLPAVIVSLLTFYSTAFSSTGSVDSTQQVANELHHLNQLVRQQIREDGISSALETARQAATLAESLPDSAEKQAALVNLGVIYSIRGEAEPAIKALKTSARIADTLNDNHNLALSLMMLGSGYSASGDFREALKAYQRALALYESLHDVIGTAKVLNNIADSYDRQGDHQKNREYLLKALKINREIQEWRGVGLQLLNLGSLDRDEGNYDRALAQLREALSIFRSQPNQLRTVQTLTELAEVHFQTGKFKDALAGLQEAESIAKERGFQKSLFEILILSARTFAELERPDEADAAMTEATGIAEELKLNKDLSKLLQASSTIYSKRGAYKQALDEFTAYHEILVQDLRTENNKANKELYARFDADRKTNEIALLNKEKQLQQLRLEQQQNNQERLSVALAILLLLLLLLLWLAQSNLRAKRLIQEQNDELTEAFRKMKSLARHDYLTDLLNRRGFSDIIEYEFGRQHRNQQPIAFVLCDIDYFKQVNDKYGHECGDLVLMQLAQLLGDNIREQDTVCRWGGEEFLIMMPETRLEDSTALAERIREMVEHADFNCKSHRLKMTVTLGVACCTRNDDPNGCIDRADSALYEGKSAGRNRVAAA